MEDSIKKIINDTVDLKMASMTNMAVPNHLHNTYDSNQLDPASALLGFPVIQVADARVAPADVPLNGTFRFLVDTTPRYRLWAYMVYQSAPTGGSPTTLIASWKSVALT